MYIVFGIWVQKIVQNNDEYSFFVIMSNFFPNTLDLYEIYLDVFVIGEV